MTGTKQSARILAASAADMMPFWGLVDCLSICAPKDQPIERPQPIDVAIRPLTGMPDCPLCSLDVNACRCDPEAYGEAVYARMTEATSTRPIGGVGENNHAG